MSSAKRVYLLPLSFVFEMQQLTERAGYKQMTSHGNGSIWMRLGIPEILLDVI